MLLAKKQCTGSKDDWQSLESNDMQGCWSKVTSNACRVKADTILDFVRKSAGSNLRSTTYATYTILVSNGLKGLIGRIEQQAWRRRSVATAAYGGGDVTTSAYLKRHSLRSCQALFVMT